MHAARLEFELAGAIRTLRNDGLLANMPLPDYARELYCSAVSLWNESRTTQNERLRLQASLVYQASFLLGRLPSWRGLVQHVPVDVKFVPAFGYNRRLYALLLLNHGIARCMIDLKSPDFTDEGLVLKLAERSLRLFNDFEDSATSRWQGEAVVLYLHWLRRFNGKPQTVRLAVDQTELALKVYEHCQPKPSLTHYVYAQGLVGKGDGFIPGSRLVLNHEVRVPFASEDMYYFQPSAE